MTEGVPAGFAELDRRIEGEIELVQFGLMPAFIGQGLGRYFLQWTIDKAWPLGDVLERYRLHDDVFVLLGCHLGEPEQGGYRLQVRVAGVLGGSADDQLGQASQLRRERPAGQRPQLAAVARDGAGVFSHPRR